MVVCAVKLCRNYTGKNIKPPEGISFHRFPTDPEQKQHWIASIRREPGWSPGTHCRVCSVHFESTDFKISDTGRRILHKDAVPSKNLYQEERSDVAESIFLDVARKLEKRKTPKPRSCSTDCEILACRCCLAIDTPLTDLQGDSLLDTYEALVGSEISTDLSMVCQVCAAGLRRAADLRARCLASTAVLDSVRARGGLITTEDIRTIDRALYRLTTPLSIKKLPIIDTTEIDIKQERLDYECEEDNTMSFDIFDDLERDGDIDVVNEAALKETETDDVKDERTESDLENESLKVYASLMTPKNEIYVHDNTSKQKKDKKKETKEVRKIKRRSTQKKEDIRNTKARKTDEDYKEFSKAFDVEITFLTEQEQIDEVLARKESDNYKNSRFKCDICFKGFAAEGAFKNHAAKHDPSVGKYVCGPCGFRFPKRYKMLNHLTHHKINFMCRLCRHVSKLPTKAKEHFKWHIGVKYPCHYCDKTFIKRTSQFNHMRNRHGSACCLLCEQVFSGERGLAAHLIKAHRDAAGWRCTSCGIQFHSEEALERHGVCQPDISPCAQCGENFESEDALNEHARMTHWTEIKCEKCNANFENEKLYRTHRLIHKESRERHPRSLQPGRATGVTGGVGVVKEKKGAKVQKRMCEMCGLTWRSAAALRYHQRVHTGEKPHQCAVCPKSFRILDSLQIHMNTHTGARPFQCPHCPKAFKSRTQNHKHQLVHTKVRRYRCSLCAKSFQTSTCVKTHVRAVHMKIAPPGPRTRVPPIH